MNMRIIFTLMIAILPGIAPALAQTASDLVLSISERPLPRPDGIAAATTPPVAPETLRAVATPAEPAPASDDVAVDPAEGASPVPHSTILPDAPPSEAARPIIAPPAQLSGTPTTSPETPEEAAPLLPATADSDAPKLVTAAAPSEAEPAPVAKPESLSVRPAPKPEITPAQAPPKGPPARILLRETDTAYKACTERLRIIGARYTIPDPVSDSENPDCGIERPISVSSILPGITVTQEAVMRCETALHQATWLRDFVRPASRTLPDSPKLTGISISASYQCRNRNGTDDAAALSEHALGNAIDISGFEFQELGLVPVEPRSSDGDMIEAFQQTARASACLFFSTVLGPGSDAAHDDHLHLDIIDRKGGYRLCK